MYMYEYRKIGDPMVKINCDVDSDCSHIYSSEGCVSLIAVSDYIPVFIGKSLGYLRLLVSP